MQAVRHQEKAAEEKGLTLYLPVNKPSLLCIIYCFPLFVSWRQCFNRLRVQFWDDACICTGSC